MPVEFSAVLVKGRGNYVSLRRLDNALARAGSLFSDEEEFDELRQIAAWAKHSGDGSLSDLDFRPHPAVWDEVASDHGNCMGRSCPHYKDCFYYRARRRVSHAQILVVNHALFFTDLALRREGVSILPNYDVVIFDEAHTLEAVAGDHLGLSISNSQVEFTLRRLYNERTNRGLLVHHRLREAQKQAWECRDAGRPLLRRHRRLARGPAARQRPGAAAENRRELPERGPGRAGRLLRRDAKKIEKRGRAPGPAGRRRPARRPGRGDRAMALPAARRTPSTGSRHRRAGGGSGSSCRPCRWTSGRSSAKNCSTKVPSVIMTSATLAAAGRFDFFQSRIGLLQAESLCLGSPFDYQRQAQLILPKDMPDPAGEPARYEQAVVEMIRRYVGRSDGHAFVLLTSYEMMKRVAAAPAPWLAEQNLALYSQADGVPRSRMLEQFKANPRGVLFGVDSFWQGVDVPGDALQNVIITRLPFSVPDRPLAGGPPGRDPRRRRQPLSRLPIARGHFEAQAGFRAVDPQQGGHGHGGDSRSPRADEALRPAVSGVASRLPAGGGMRGSADALSRQEKSATLLLLSRRRPRWAVNG